MKVRGVWRAMLLFTVAVGAVGCGGGNVQAGMADKLKYAAPPQSVLMNGVSVQFQLAHARERNFKIHLHVMNLSSQVMVVQPSGIGLRLPDGRLLARRPGNREPFIVPPGAGHDVHVDFSEPGLDMRTLEMASIVVGGISFTGDPRPRIVGEIPLSQAGPAD